MEYYIVDKCYNVENTQSLVINCGNNKENGTKLEPCDISKVKGQHEAKYTLCDFESPIDISEYHYEEQYKFFDFLCISDINVFYNVETKPYIDTHETDNLSFITKIKRLNCYKKFPTIMFTYKMSTSTTISNRQKWIEMHFGKEDVIPIKPNNFENSIDLCLTTNIEKIIDNCSTTYFKCDVQQKIRKTSIITYNGDKYIFDPVNITNMYCVCTTPMSEKRSSSWGAYTWEFFCIARLYYINEPTITKVTEEVFKNTSKCNADIVIYNNKTYLMKNTSNSNVVFNYSTTKDNKNRHSNYLDLADKIIEYTSTCSNCKNCYNCYKCDNCEDCEACDNCIGCISCNDCINCEYYDHTQYTNMKLFKLDDDEDDEINEKSEKIKDIDVYTKYVKKYVA